MSGPPDRSWVVLEEPRPPRVADRYDHWGEEPPELSPRCTWWVRQIKRGWRPNKHICRYGYDSAAEWYGVWIWEYVNVIRPLLRKLEGR